MLTSSHDATCHEVSDVDATLYHSVDCGSEILHGSHEFQRHHLVGQPKVSDSQITTTIEHFDDTHQMLALFGWGTPMLDEHGDISLSLQLLEVNGSL